MLLIVVALTVSCMVDKNYTDIYDIHYQANKAIDDPALLIEGFQLITVHKEKTEYPIGSKEYYARSKEYSDSLYSANYWALSQLGNDLINDPIKEIDYQLNELLASLIMAAPLYSIRIPYNLRVPRNPALTSAGFKISNFKHYHTIIDGVKVQIIKGNKTMGMKHVIKRHTPDYYLRNELIPTSKTSLFMGNNVSYVNSLIKKCNKGNMTAHYIGEKGNNMMMEFSIRNNIGIKRKYILVYDKNTTNMVSFFPSSNIPSSSTLFKKTPGNYQKIILQKEEVTRLNKLKIMEEIKRNKLNMLNQIP